MKILLSTINARYHHASLGLRYLRANLEEWRERSEIVEFTIQQDVREIVEKLLAQQPNFIGFGVYIWNNDLTLKVVQILKRVAPEIVIILGGPEVSYESEQQLLCQIADHTIQGEGEHALLALLRSYGSTTSPKMISTTPQETDQLKLPYREYTAQDIQHRTIYVEASRGCPFKCEYCLSSLDKSVRPFDLDLFLNEMQWLMDQGVRQFKFIDRTFNLNPTSCSKILNFFIERIQGPVSQLPLFLHFEMVPDRLPDAIKELLPLFPAGSLQFEIGIQTFNPLTASLVSRKQDVAKIAQNLTFLKQSTHVHTHADLIVGLPGETLASFAEGFNRLAQLQPDEIQVGILKRLRGTPIIRHDEEWGMLYQNDSPYTVLKTKTMSYKDIQNMIRFAKVWDLVANSGNFIKTLELLLQDDPFHFFMELTDYLSTQHPTLHSIALPNLVRSLWEFGTHKTDSEKLRLALIEDYAQSPAIKRDIPAFLRDPHEQAKKTQTSNKKSETIKNDETLRPSTHKATKRQNLRTPKIVRP